MKAPASHCLPDTWPPGPAIECRLPTGHYPSHVTGGGGVSKSAFFPPRALPRVHTAPPARQPRCSLASHSRCPLASQPHIHQGGSAGPPPRGPSRLRRVSRRQPWMAATAGWSRSAGVGRPGGPSSRAGARPHAARGHACAHNSHSATAGAAGLPPGSAAPCLSRLSIPPRAPHCV